MKKVLAVLMVICIALSLCGCTFLKDVADSAKIEEPKTFEFEDISIELTSRYLRMDFISEDYDFIVGNEEVTVMGLKVEAEEDVFELMTVRDYAVSFHSLLEADNPTEVTEIDGIPTMQYNSYTDDGKKQTTAVMFYKGSDCFWVITFTSVTEKFDDNYSDICKFAKSVKCR